MFESNAYVTAVLGTGQYSAVDGLGDRTFFFGLSHRRNNGSTFFIISFSTPVLHVISYSMYLLRS